MSASSAREDWERRIGRRSDPSAPLTAEALRPPRALAVEAGTGLVTLRWEPVEGAIGYLIHHARSPDGPWERLDHGGRDVLSYPGPPYGDTTGEPGEERWYAVSSVAAVEAETGELSDPVAATPSPGPAGAVTARVRADRRAGDLDPVWHMVGSEHLSQLLYAERTGGRPIGPDFEAALRLAHEEIGADRVRAHAILHDESGVYREVDGAPVYDFSRVDEIYDRVLAAGLRPLVELSFMPHDLAADPEPTIFEYRGHISPPDDWERWGELNRRLAEHLVDRYGIDEVARWGFEVWNEANLEVFWSGTQAEYFRLYDVAARAIKSVDERLQVGGPSTAATGWITDFLDFVVAEGAPLDFVSTHTYGNMPLDVREALRVRGLGDVDVFWTEWGTTPTHFYEVSDAAWGATFVLHGMKSVQGRADALAYWVVSDHFEELGRPPRLFHGGFGLLTVGNLRKPRYWALALAESLGTDLVELELGGDGAGTLLDGWATRRPDGSVALLLWNGTLEQQKATGAPILDRDVEVTVEGLEPGRYRATLARMDVEHTNIGRHWPPERDWPADEDEWRRLKELDRLDEEELDSVDAPDGCVELTLRLPMPGVARLVLRPAR